MFRRSMRGSCDAAPPAVTFRQIKNAERQNLGQAAVALAQPVVAGDLLVVFVGWYTTGTVPSVADTDVDPFVRATGPTTSGTETQSIYYACGVAAAATEADANELVVAGDFGVNVTSAGEAERGAAAHPSRGVQVEPAGSRDVARGARHWMASYAVGLRGDSRGDDHGAQARLVSHHSSQHQGTHIHLLVEAKDRRALSKGMQAFKISAAKLRETYEPECSLEGLVPR
jgi:hypothetical protein